jgi:tetratricopeptide (TPR) repeat protein/TolB-like protein/predicted Ser/Thr protein kinase
MSVFRHVRGEDMDDGKPPAYDSDSPTLPGRSSASGREIGSAEKTPPPLPSDALTLHDSSPAPEATLPPVGSHGGMATLRLGSVLGGRYQILRVLGEGGMGAVYQARDRELDRLIALKVIRPELAGNPSILQRFKQELILARNVTHKNVVRIFDLGEADGVRFITMEYIEGSDLRSLLHERGKFTPTEAVTVIKQVCRALQAAHAEGVIHRDLKPQNIMRDRNGRIVVMDFGLARSLGDPGMTQSGALVGTLEYMSPEQAMGLELDPRSDLYALGLIFYELLIGKSPFKADSALASLMKRTQEQAVPASDVDKNVPAAVSAIVSRCLEREPSKRYGSVSELLQQLEAWESNPHLSASTIRRADAMPRSVQITLPFSARRIWMALAVVALLLAVLFAVPSARNFILRRQPAGVTGVRGIPDLKQGKYVAVLPLRILGDQKALQYVADGLVEALAAKLFPLKDVHIASGPAVETAAQKGSLEKIARALGVNLIVQGTVQGSADRFRVVVSLQDVNGGRQVWTQEFSGVPQDLLTLEDQIYAQLLGALELQPTDEERARTTAHPTENVEAYDLYLRGRNAMRGWQDLKNVESAIGYYEAAIKQDAGFALAYTGLADASLRLYKERKDSLWAEKAQAAALQAERLNDKLPEVHLALGSVYTATGKTGEAAAELKRAQDLAPNSDEVYRRLGDVYRASGKKEEALAAYQKAVNANPYFWVNHDALGGAYLRFGETQKALPFFRKVTELEPENAIGFDNIGNVYLREGKYQECIPFYERALKIQPYYATYSNLGTAYFFLKRYDDAVKMFEQAVAMNPNEQQAAANLADAYRWSGRSEQAKATYDKAIALAYKELRVNPRDASILSNLGLFYAKKGSATQALNFIRQARGIDRNDVSLIYDEAVVESLSGDQRAALRALREALRKGYPAEEAQSDPELAKLQALPEFTAVLKEFEKK